MFPATLELCLLPAFIVAGAAPRSADVERSCDPEQIQRLVEQLADPQWSVRDQAERRLRDLGPDLVPSLARAFQAAEDRHTRLTIRSIVHSIFTREQMIAHYGAFLGVQQRLLNDPRVLDGRPGVLIVRVLPGTAAEQAGLRDGDVILAINGRPFAATQQAEDFAEIVRRYPPGTEVALELLRGEQITDVSIRLGERPFRYADADVRQRIQFAFSEMWTRDFAGEQQQELEYIGGGEHGR